MLLTPHTTCPVPQGFSENWFANFSSQPVISTVTNQFGKSYNLVVTPKVKEEVRSMTGCASLVGAALEEDGGTGTTGNHWEYRLYPVSSRPGY